ncbi:hypothetical protein AGMMS49975_04660 [Clostridia bacterium]|nr:hypothetical protein AGMMS49975_04660 [Clostridia bacterium]
MVKTITAYTEEIDDIELAVGEILGQLELEKNPLKNSIGIIACHYEFVFSGVFEALSKALPFDVVGNISSVQAVNGASGTLILTLMVLTSDDVSFEVVLTESLLESPGKVIEDTYKSIQPEQKPKAILMFAPFMPQNSGDEYVNALTKASGGIPCFGTLAVDDTTTFENCFMLFNGAYYTDRMAMLLLYGELNPRFYIATISPEKVRTESPALITKSAGHILIEINGRPVMDFFESLGLAQASETAYALTSLPFMLDYNDGTPQVSKVFIRLTEEKHAICGGATPEGSTLYLGVADKDDILFTTSKLIEKVYEETPSCVLGFSCVARNMSLGANQLEEVDLFRTAAKSPFMISSAGGEICPTQTSDNNAINRFHNTAFVVLVL